MQLKFTIGENTYNIPEVASVAQFESSIQWDPNQEKNWKPFVSTLTGAPLRDLGLLEEDVFNFILGACINAITVEDEAPKQVLQYNKIIEPEDLTFGQFIDIDLYTTIEPLTHIKEIGAIAYNTAVDDVAQWPIRDVWPAFLALNRWRKQVYRDFDSFFELEGKEREEGTRTTLSQLHKMWYDIILVLADHKFLNIEPVVNRPWREALNWLTWKKQKVAEEKLEILKKSNDLQRNSK